MPFLNMWEISKPQKCNHSVKKVIAVEKGYKIICNSCGLETKPLDTP